MLKENCPHCQSLGWNLGAPNKNREKCVLRPMVIKWTMKLYGPCMKQRQQLTANLKQEKVPHHQTQQNQAWCQITSWPWNQRLPCLPKKIHFRWLAFKKMAAMGSTFKKQILVQVEEIISYFFANQTEVDSTKETLTSQWCCDCQGWWYPKKSVDVSYDWLGCKTLTVQI